MNLNIRGQITQERDQLNAELKIEQQKYKNLGHK